MSDISTIEFPLSFVSKIKFERNEKEIGLGGVNSNEQWDGFEHFFYGKIVIEGGTRIIISNYQIYLNREVIN